MVPLPVLNRLLSPDVQVLVGFSEVALALPPPRVVPPIVLLNDGAWCWDGPPRPVPRDSNKPPNAEDDDSCREDRKPDAELRALSV